MRPILREITSSQLKERTPFKVGDGVRVHTKVREGDKERIQIFAGIVIARRGTGIESAFTVRRIASGVGVERVFPLHSPNVEKIEVDRDAVVGKARLYYIRDRIGKEATKVNEKRLMESMGVKVEQTPEQIAAKAEKKAAAAAAKEASKAKKVAAKAEKATKAKAVKAEKPAKKEAKSEKTAKADKKTAAKKKA